jgi:hypothetical protein
VKGQLGANQKSTAVGPSATWASSRRTEVSRLKGSASPRGRSELPRSDASLARLRLDVRGYGAAIQFQVRQLDCVVEVPPDAYWLTNQTRPWVAPVVSMGSGLAPA